VSAPLKLQTIPLYVLSTKVKVSVADASATCATERLKRPVRAALLSAGLVQLETAPATEPL